MPDSSERVAVIEVLIKDMRYDVERLRNHIGELLRFKSEIEGGIAMSRWMLGFVGLTNLVILLKVFFK